MKRLKTFIKNLKHLGKVDLKSLQEPHLDYDLILNNLKYELYDEIQNLKIPSILNVEDSIRTLVTNQQASFCRFGDGEIQLLKGKDIPFQKASFALTERLKEILSSKNEDIFIAIPLVLYASKRNIVPFAKNWWREHGQAFRNELEKYIDFNHPYYAAELTLASNLFESYDVKAYFEKIAKIWQDQAITIVCGETVFQHIEYNIFDVAESVDYVFAPSLNAFDVYDTLLERCRAIPQHHVIILILGPTAKVLAYDLAQQGFRALDLGHIAKSYDWYRKQKSAKDLSSAIDFFNPD
jgi:glycosyltransferase family protein